MKLLKIQASSDRWCETCSQLRIREGVGWETGTCVNCKGRFRGVGLFWGLELRRVIGNEVREPTVQYRCKARDELINTGINVSCVPLSSSPEEE